MLESIVTPAASAAATAAPINGSISDCDRVSHSQSRIVSVNVCHILYLQ